MKKAKSPVRRALLLLVAVPLLGIACDDDEEEGTIEAQFIASPTSGTAPLEVTFTDQSTGDITAWQWDFDGDGTIDNVEQNPTHTYETDTLK